jgi:hypothetical protein
MLAMSLSEDLVREIYVYYQEYQANPILQDIMVDFYDRVDTLLIED